MTGLERVVGGVDGKHDDFFAEVGEADNAIEPQRNVDVKFGADVCQAVFDETFDEVDAFFEVLIEFVVVPNDGFKLNYVVVVVKVAVTFVIDGDGVVKGAGGDDVTDATDFSEFFRESVEPVGVVDTVSL